MIVPDGLMPALVAGYRIDLEFEDIGRLGGRGCPQHLFASCILEARPPRLRWTIAAVCSVVFPLRGIPLCCGPGVDIFPKGLLPFANWIWCSAPVRVHNGLTGTGRRVTGWIERG